MNYSMHLYTKCLTCAGLIPFIACALLLSTGVESVPWLGSVSTLLSVYGLVIASFLAGSHWGQHLDQQNMLRPWLAYSSNVCAIALWLGFSLATFTVFIWLLMGVFLLLLGVDIVLFRAKFITGNYVKMRVIVTVIVVLSLWVAGVS